MFEIQMIHISAFVEELVFKITLLHTLKYLLDTTTSG